MCISKPSLKWILAGITGIVIAAVLVLYLEKWVENTIKSVVADKLTAGIQLTYKEIKVSVFKSSLTFKDVVLTSHLPGMKRRAGIKTKKIRIQGIQWAGLFFHKKLNIKLVEIENPLVTLTPLDTVKIFDKNTSGTNGLKHLKIDKIAVRHGNFKILKKHDDIQPEIEADTFNLDFEGISLFVSKKDQTMNVSHAAMEFRNIFLSSEDKLNDISLGRLSFSTADSLIQLSGLKVKPKYSKRELSARMRHLKSWQEMEFPNIQIHGCQFHKLLEGALIASKISITEPRIEIFSDSNLPVDPKAYKNFPQESLLKASMGIRVDTIVVKNGTLKYENIPLNKTTTGKIDFDQMEAVFLNITNDTNKIAQNHILEIQAEARLYNKHIIKQHFWINLKSPAGDFTFTGSAANIPFAELNSFFTPALHITFEQGVINSLDYRITANHKTAKGVLTLQYEDIDFSLLNDKKEKKKILSELIDIFLVAENNIKGEKGFKKGVVDAGRDTRRSFFNFWWSAIQTGIASSVFSEKAINNIKKKSKEKNKQLD